HGQQHVDHRAALKQVRHRLRAAPPVPGERSTGGLGTSGLSSRPQRRPAEPRHTAREHHRPQRGRPEPQPGNQHPGHRHAHKHMHDVRINLGRPPRPPRHDQAPGTESGDAEHHRDEHRTQPRRRAHSGTGQYARASRTSSGPESGSVEPPVSIPPNPSTSQITTASATVKPTTPRTARTEGGYTPHAITTISTANTRPPGLSADAAWVSSHASHPGCPAAMSAIPECNVRTDPGSAASTAIVPHSTAHDTRATEAPTARPATNAAETSRSEGHSSTASTAYSSTAPGAPSSGLAEPVSTPPSPSPSHHTPSAHTTDAANAGFTVRRNAIPRPSSTCMVANAPLEIVRWCPINEADHVIGAATGAGFPAADSASIEGKALLNMAGWYWNKPSSNQRAPSASCSFRRRSTRTSSAGARASPPATTRLSLMADPFVFSKTVTRIPQLQQAKIRRLTPARYYQQCRHKPGQGIGETGPGYARKRSGRE